MYRFLLCLFVSLWLSRVCTGNGLFYRLTGEMPAEKFLPDGSPVKPYTLPDHLSANGMIVTVIMIIR